MLEDYITDLIELNEIVFYCGVCTNPCYAFTNSVVGPNRCIRSDLDVSNKAEWVVATPLTMHKGGKINES